MHASVHDSVRLRVNGAGRVQGCTHEVRLMQAGGVCRGLPRAAPCGVRTYDAALMDGDLTSLLTHVSNRMTVHMSCNDDNRHGTATAWLGIYIGQEDDQCGVTVDNRTR